LNLIKFAFFPGVFPTFSNVFPPFHPLAVIFIAALRNGSEWNSFGAYLYNCHTAMLANKKKNAKIVTKGIKKKKKEQRQPSAF